MEAFCIMERSKLVGIIDDPGYDQTYSSTPRTTESLSMKITIRQLQERLPELLDQAVETGEEYIVERNGKDYAVIVSAREWKRRIVGRRLDALGPAYRLMPAKQARTEELLERNKEGRLSRRERRELNALLNECDRIMLHRANAMDRLR
jgi:prevent-host-death family protein